MNARRIIATRAANIRHRAQELPPSDPRRAALEHEASQLEARARTAGRWSPIRRIEHRRAVALALASCPRGCSTHCAEGVCTDAHS